MDKGLSAMLSIEMCDYQSESGCKVLASAPLGNPCRSAYPKGDESQSRHFRKR